MIQIGRRSFLLGLGGALVALPALESLAPRRANAQAMPGFLLTFVQDYGVQQRARHASPHQGEAEGFWPSAPVERGQLVSLARDQFAPIVDGDASADRAVHELRGLEERISVLRGVRMHELSANHHETRRTQLLTGSSFNYDRPDRSEQHHENAWGRHESLDNRVARAGGAEPVLVARGTGGYQLSFSERGGAVESRRGIDSPVALYDSLFRSASPEPVSPRRALVTELVSAELASLKVDPRLSAADRRRIDQHFTQLRDIESRLLCAAPDTGSDRFSAYREAQTLVPDRQDDGTITGMSAMWRSRDYIDAPTDAFIELLALGAACGAFRAATLEVAGFRFQHSDVFSDPTQRAQGFPTWYHNISHRTLSTVDDQGSWSGAGVREHHAIDRWFMRRYRKLIERLAEYDALDRGVCMYTNEVATGAHEAFDVPVILAGSCNGQLRTGVMMDLQRGDSADSQLPNNRLLNTLGAALGLRSADGAPLHDFGGVRPDGSRDEGGRIDALVRGA